MKEVIADILVVGGGGAGLKAAITAREKFPKLKTVLLVKGKLGKCGCTALSCSDRMAFHATLPQTEPGGKDNWKYHAQDVFRIGGEVSDGDLAEVLARNSGRAFQYLLDAGVPFARKADGSIDQFVTDGSQYARACYTGPHTANDIEAALVKRAKEIKLDVRENTFAIDVIRDEKEERVAGLLVWEGTGKDADSSPALYRAKAIVFATGGAGSAYRVNCFPPAMTGDGQAIAWRLGAELVNMEFIQIGLSSVKTRLACSGSIMRAIPRFVNDQGEEFLRKYFPAGTKPAQMYDVVFRKGASWPVSNEEPSHVIDIAVYQENAVGRKVFLDFSRDPEGFRLEELDEKTRRRYQDEKKLNRGEGGGENTPLARLRQINAPSIKWLKERGIDLEKGDQIELAPAIQHFQGGVKIRTKGETTIPGLYACGECAGGQHGANRPGGNALMDSQVFGEIAGTSAGEDAGRIKDLPAANKKDLEAAQARLLLVQEGKSPTAADVRREVLDLMSLCGSVVRTEKRLKEGLSRLVEIKRAGIGRDKNGVVFALETQNLLDVAEIVLNACLSRKESRGPHLFFARPEDIKPLPRDDEHGKVYHVLRKDGERVIIERRKPVPLTV